jgi:asparagine synthase (glutamine-hydrolysing)
MCGIAGHVTSVGTNPDGDAVRAAIAYLAHRGPDGSGIREFRTACLGHRRLSVIDVDGSPQPWSSEDERYTIVFNGEIYNYLELRRDLSAKGFSFRTQGDTEVLLATYIRYGTGCLDRLNGMFAFAIWDEHTQQLFLARDRLGKKPLFFALLNGGIAFSSEINPLLTFSGVSHELDPAAINSFFAYQYITAPRTIYRDIRKLEAGHWLSYHEGSAKLTRYWTPPLPRQPSRDDVCEELRWLLEDAVRLRLRSDVPLGAFLSGGLDSSIIVGLMARLGITVESFHVGFNHTSFDESIHAKIAADHFHTRHHSQIVSFDQDQTLRSALRHFGEPFADASAIPMWHLCRHTRKTVTVALSGDGADELFAGYRRYYARRFVGTYLRLPSALRSAISRQLMRWLPDNNEYYSTSLAKKLRLAIELAERTASAPEDFLAQTFSPEERRSLLKEDISAAVPDQIRDIQLEKLDDVSRMMFTDMLVYLPDDILAKVDHMSMAHALEVRSPFLDYRLVEFACRLPLSLKLSGSTQKSVLRAAFGQLLPGSLSKRQKHGFAVPVGHWFRGPLKDTFCQTVLESPAVDLLNRNTINALWAAHQTGRIDHGQKLWSLLVFHRWYHERVI